MLAQEVLVEQGLPEGALLGAESNGVVGAAGDLLQYGGVRRRLRGRCPPREGAVAGDEHGRHRDRVDVRERLDDHVARRALVALGDLFVGQGARARHLAVEVVGMGGAEARERPARLRPHGRPPGVGVGDAADPREGAVQLQVRRQVRRRLQTAEGRAVQIDHGHRLLGQLGVGNSARLDDHDARATVDRADVAPRLGHEPPLDELPVRFEHTPLQLVVHRTPRLSPETAP